VRNERIVATILRSCSFASIRGKETDRRWEQGEDLSLVEFETVEYQGSKQVVASDEIKEQILKTGICKIERETRVSHHTINRILKGSRFDIQHSPRSRKDFTSKTMLLLDHYPIALRVIFP